MRSGLLWPTGLALDGPEMLLGQVLGPRSWLPAGGLPEVLALMGTANKLEPWSLSTQEEAELSPTSAVLSGAAGEGLGEEQSCKLSLSLMWSG